MCSFKIIVISIVFLMTSLHTGITQDLECTYGEWRFAFKILLMYLRVSE